LRAKFDGRGKEKGGSRRKAQEDKLCGSVAGDEGCPKKSADGKMHPFVKEKGEMKIVGSVNKIRRLGNLK